MAVGALERAECFVCPGAWQGSAGSMVRLAEEPGRVPIKQPRDKFYQRDEIRQDHTCIHKLGSMHLLASESSVPTAASQL